MAKVIKTSEVKEHQEPKLTGNDGFAFGKINIILFLAGVVMVVLGFVLMSGGGSDNPAEFSEEVFSARRITLAPVTVLLGFAVIAVAIMFKPRD